MKSNESILSSVDGYVVHKVGQEESKIQKKIEFVEAEIATGERRVC